MADTINAAWMDKQMPNFAADLIKSKIAPSFNAKHDDFITNIGGHDFFILDKSNVAGEDRRYLPLILGAFCRYAHDIDRTPIDNLQC